MDINMDASRQVAAELRAIMARQNRKQIELAAHLNMSQAALSNRLNGQQALTIDELMAIGLFLQADVPGILRDAMLAKASA
jgi:transcriptional regulator with XRE-family HTH domain